MMATFTLDTKTCPRCRVDKPRSDYYRDVSHSTGYSRYCKVCDAARGKEWRLRNFESQRIALRDNRRLRKYGLTREDYLKMFDIQRGECAICGATEGGHGRTDELLVDHDHTTGEVRGLLCHGCNGGLGHFRDNVDVLQSAMLYLESSGVI